MDITTIIVSAVVGAIASWWIARLLNRYFSKSRRNEEIIGIYEKRLEEKEKGLQEKDEIIEEITKDRRRREKEKRRIVDSLKRSGLSAEKLVRSYDKPLNAILISYAAQKEPTETGYYKSCKFIREELNRYDGKNVGGADALIPPTKVPKWIKNNADLKSW